MRESIRWERFAFWFASLAAIIVCSAAHAQTIRPTIEGTVSYEVSYGAGGVRMDVERIANRSPTRTSGSLQLDLWATTTPYNGGTITGYQIATYRLPGNGQLAPNTVRENIVAQVPLMRPPGGAYYATLTLSEFSSTCTSSDQFCLVDHETFSAPLSVPPSEPVFTPADEEEGGGSFEIGMLALLASVGIARWLRSRAAVA